MHPKSYPLLAALLAAAALGAPAARAQAPLPPLEERAYVASRLYASVQGSFAHWDDAADVDLDSAYRAYLGAALTAPDRLTFSQESQAFLAGLRNGHTLFVDRALMDQPEGRPLGFTLRHVEGRWAVAQSQVPGLAPGDVVAAIDGQPFEAFYQASRRTISASTEQWARRVLFEHVPGFFTGAVHFPVAFTLTLADGRQVPVDRRATPDFARGPTEGRWLREGRVAYVRIPSFSEPRFEEKAVELVTQFRDAEALVVDVRGNTGGSTPSHLTGALMERPYRWWAGSTPMSPALHRAWAEGGNGWYEDFRRPHIAWPARTMQPGDTPFRGRVILLVDGGCNSACEDFVMPFKDTGRATLVGQTTAGSTGQPYMADLGGGMMALVGAKRERFPDGGVFESVGIRPDVEVAPRLADLRAGRDAALDRALHLALARD